MEAESFELSCVKIDILRCILCGGFHAGMYGLTRSDEASDVYSLKPSFLVGLRMLAITWRRSTRGKPDMLSETY